MICNISGTNQKKNCTITIFYDLISITLRDLNSLIIRANYKILTTYSLIFTFKFK